MQSYLSRVSKKVFAPTIRAMDILGFTLPPIVSGSYSLVGKPMPDDVGQIIALSIMGGGLAFVILRLITAPYFIWKDDQSEIARLHGIIDAPTQMQREKAVEAQESDRAEMLRELAGLVDWIGGVSRIAFHGDETRRRLEKYALRFMGEKDFWMHWDLLSKILVTQGHYMQLVEIGAFHERWHNELLSLNSEKAEHHIRCLIAILSGEGPERIDHEKLDEFERRKKEIYARANAEGVLLQEHQGAAS